MFLIFICIKWAVVIDMMTDIIKFINNLSLSDICIIILLIIICFFIIFNIDE